MVPETSKVKAGVQTGRPTAERPKKRPKPVQHDETPSGVTSHAFEPKGAWYTLCKHCNLAESAHLETTTADTPHEGRRFKVRYYSDDNPDD